MTPNNLTSRLSAGLDDDQQAALGDLQPVEQQLDDWQVPEPTDEEKLTLKMALLHELPARPAQRSGWQGWKNLLLAQIRLFESEFWYTCAGILIFLLIGGLTIGVESLPLYTIFISPLLAMAGVLYVFHHDSEGLAQLEAVSPMGELGLFFCRSGLVLGINLVVFAALLIPVEAYLPGMSFWRVLAIWLGVLVGLFGLAVFTSTRWNGLLGTVLPLGVWGLLIGMSWQQAIGATGNWNQAAYWLLNTVNSSNAILHVALVSLALGLLLFIQAARHTRQGNHQWA